MTTFTWKEGTKMGLVNFLKPLMVHELNFNRENYADWTARFQKASPHLRKIQRPFLERAREDFLRSERLVGFCEAVAFGDCTLDAADFMYLIRYVGMDNYRAAE